MEANTGDGYEIIEGLDETLTTPERSKLPASSSHTVQRYASERKGVVVQRDDCALPPRNEFGYPARISTMSSPVGPSSTTTPTLVNSGLPMRLGARSTSAA